MLRMFTNIAITIIMERYPMLVLTRKTGEEIIINYHGQITTITICGLEGNKVRVGVTAPKSVVVDRREVHERRMAEAESEFDHSMN